MVKLAWGQNREGTRNYFSFFHLLGQSILTQLGRLSEELID